MPPAVAYRVIILLLWALVVLDAAVARGLFWDGASFLANMLEFGTFHDFYPERSHVDWVTQAPTLLLAEAGVRNTRLLAIVYSASLYAWPAALYHVALARVRRDATLMAAVAVALAAVYLPTSFFIVGEYNVAYAAVMAAMAVVVTGGAGRRRDGVILCAFGALCQASYEAMLYLGPLVAAAILWGLRRARRAGATDDIGSLLALLAALTFLSSALVSLQAVVEYWNLDYFVRVRAATFDFWQNLQFVIPFVGLAILVVVSIVLPRWLERRGPALLLGLVALLLAATPWLRRLDPEAMLFPPAHHIARTAAGGLVVAIAIAMWLHVGWRHAGRWGGPPRVLVELRRPEVGRRLLSAASALLLAAAVPDVALSRLWVGYLDYFRGLVTGHTGLVRANDLPMRQWPQRLFSQDWTYPALSALVRSAPGQGIVVMDKDYRSNPPFEPSCGTVPRLEGYAWR
ncbi:MAG: hypothetical protein JSR90_00535 [Proteobacteria bacterium]|nr:hypothetical protein [Pseudomonadota bacterium]